MLILRVGQVTASVGEDVRHLRLVGGHPVSRLAPEASHTSLLTHGQHARGPAPPFP